MYGFLDWLDYGVNFWRGVQHFCWDLFNYVKFQMFEGKLTYYALFNTKTNEYSLIYDYSKFLNSFHKMPVKYDDMKYILQFSDCVIVANYILYGKEHHDILDYNSISKPKHSIHDKVIYAYTDTNEDLTHEFELFKNTIFTLKSLTAQQLYTVLMCYKNKQANNIKYIKVMLDNNFEEIVYK